MKTTLIMALALMLAAAARAQDAGIAEKADMFYLDIHRPILALREVSAATVRLRMSAAIKGDEISFDENVAAGASGGFGKNYAIENWRVLEPGNTGQIVSTTGDQASYTAPAAKPAQGFVTLAVDLVPRAPGHPKVTLMGKVEITDAETTFTLDVPGLGVKGERYTLASNDSTMLDQTLARLPPAQRQKIEAQMILAGSAKGIDLTTMMKKARAAYSSQSDATSVLIQIPVAGGAEGMIALTFKGRSAGTFHVMPDEAGNKNMVTVTRPNQQGFSGGHGQYEQRGGSKTLRLNCPACTIAIDSYDSQWVKGSVTSEVDLFVGEEIVRGRLVGRFKVPVAK